ncbi:MAG: hypothetical protein R3190_17590, partial [Thermoanaerobaculia bacterium]|nr:hypothetical protein [Thermoanaerobaculia bacterium]
MITGFNTDVRRGEVVFHVQTEDKGLHNPCIESLVYVGGQILARRRAGYRSLLKEGRGKEDIARLMEHQHRLLIDEIRGGKLDQRLEEARGVRPATPPPETEDAEKVPGGDGAPAADETGAEELAVEEAAAGEAAAEEPAAREPGTEELAADEAAARGPEAEEPEAEKPAVEAPSAAEDVFELVGEEPVADLPVAEAQPSEPPVEVAPDPSLAAEVVPDP